MAPRSITAATACLLASATAFSSSAAPRITLISAGPPSTMQLQRESGSYTEVPPVIIPLPAEPPPASCGLSSASSGPLASVFVSTAWAVNCIADGASALPVDGVTPLGMVNSTCITPIYGMSQAGFPPSDIPVNTDYRRDYYGVFSAARADWSPSQPMLFLSMHGEDKNELWGSNLYQNTINTDVNASTCYSGDHNGTYQDCFPAYNGLASGMLLNFTAAACYGAGAHGGAAYIDLGPVAWPLNGYVNATGGKMSYGLRDPSVVRGFDGMLYFTYVDGGLDLSTFHAVRSPPGMYQGMPTTFMARNATSGAWDIPSMPPGYDVANVSASFSLPASGAAWRQPLIPMPDTLAGVRLSVARVEDVGVYLAVYTAVNYSAVTCDDHVPRRSPAGDWIRSCDSAAAPPWVILLTASADFVTWSDAVKLPYDADSWGDAFLQYPTFLNANGTDSGSIRASDGFYIMGTCSHAACAQPGQEGPSVQLAHIQLTLS